MRASSAELHLVDQAGATAAFLAWPAVDLEIFLHLAFFA